MKEARRPELELRMTCELGGKPGGLVVSPDASRLFVFDQGLPKVSVVGISSWTIVDRFELDPTSDSSVRVLGGFGETIFIGGVPGKIGVLGAASQRPGGAIPCAGDACDLELLPELSRAVVATACGGRGFIEFIGLAPVQPLGRLELPLPPVRGTLTLLPRMGLGAVGLRGASPGDEAIALFECRAGSDVCLLPLEGGVSSLAFDSEGRYLHAACHDASSLAVIDLRLQRVAERVLLAGEPYSLTWDRIGRCLWVLCERLGHLVIFDPRDRMVIRRTPMPGVWANPRRIVFSPEGRLAVIPEPGEGCLSLVEGGTPGASYGELIDRVELARDVTDVAWSPLGEEIYATSPRTGALLRLGVERGDQEIKDTDLYLMDQLLRQEDPAALKNPLFPP